MNIFPIRRKDLFVDFRWFLILILLLMVIYRRSQLIYPTAAYLLVAVLFISNLFLTFMKSKVFDDLFFSYAVFLIDIGTISLTMYFCQETESDFYLLYFLTIFMSSITGDIRGSLPVALVVSGLYGFLVMRSSPDGTRLSDPRFLMRIPFFFMVALFSGFLVQQARKKVEDREKQLDERLKRQERLTMLGQMAAWVAHEIRSPLATIKGRAHLIKAEARGDGETYQHAQSIDRASNLIERIIEDILGFSRENRPGLESLNLNSLVEDVLSSYREAGSRRRVALRSSLKADLPKVKVNGEELRRVILNLLDNSFEALKGDGEIEVRTGWEKGWVKLQVWDSGSGIPEGSLNRVFDPFYSTKPKGTGLGLSIVHKIVDDHDGTIELESGTAGGTLFTVRLPVGPG